MYSSDVKISSTKANRSSFINHLCIAFAVYAVCKLSVYLALQIAFLNLRSKWSRLTLITNYTNLDKQQTGEQLQELESLMQYCGVVIRESGSIAVLVFGYLISANIVSTLSDTLTRGRISACYKRDSFFFSYLNESVSDEQLGRTFDRYLRKMISLNLYKKKTIVINSHLSQFKSDESKLLVIDLNQQQAQLREFLTDKSSIWPANRQRDWRNEQISFAPRLYAMIISVYFAYCVSLIYANQHYCVHLLEMRFRCQLTLLERSSLAEYYIVILVVIEPILAPMVLLAVSETSECI